MDKYLLKNCQVFDEDQCIDLLIERGIITKIGKNIKAKCEIFDFESMLTITPGLIDAHTHLGISKTVIGGPGEDTNESSGPITPQLRAFDAIDPFDPAFEDAIRGGITTVMIAPGSANPIGGSCTIMTTAFDTDNRILVENAGLKMALGENPKRVYGSTGKAPVTRMGVAALIRKTLFDAVQYEKKKGEKKDADFMMEALLPLIRKEIPARIHAHESYDIETALRIGKEFGIDVVLEHSTAAYTVPNIPPQQLMTLGPLFSARKKPELKARCYESAVLLHDRGHSFALTTDHPVIPVDMLRVQAAYCIAFGLPRKAALDSITINAAKVLGIDHLTGSIEVGKRADLVLWSGDPFSVTQLPELVFVGGNVIWSLDEEEIIKA